MQPCEVAAEGMLWMLAQPLSYSGQLESMHELRHREGITASRVPAGYLPPHLRTDLIGSLVTRDEAHF